MTHRDEHERSRRRSLLPALVSPYPSNPSRPTATPYSYTSSIPDISGITSTHLPPAEAARGPPAGRSRSGGAGVGLSSPRGLLEELFPNVKAKELEVLKVEQVKQALVGRRAEAPPRPRQPRRFHIERCEDIIESILERTSDEKILVFSQWTSFLDLIEGGGAAGRRSNWGRAHATPVAPLTRRVFHPDFLGDDVPFPVEFGVVGVRRSRRASISSKGQGHGPEAQECAQAFSSGSIQNEDLRSNARIVLEDRGVTPSGTIREGADEEEEEMNHRERRG
ncbi:MAG: hypothetical protein M1823_004697 [Watsoniomyces obsoletus]|nr:MAG: hypothetical protein M1823_004697 [Watsoniomyces obsoletus]